MSPPILVGRSYSGHLLCVAIELMPKSTPMYTVEHELVSDVMGLRIEGSLWDPRDMRGPLRSGRIFDAIPLVQPREEWDGEDLDRLHEIWRRWNFNDFRPECAHMELPEDPTYAGRQFVVCEQQLRAGELPPYRYGSSWLYAPLPDDVVEDVLRFQSCAGKPGYRLSDGLRMGRAQP